MAQRTSTLATAIAAGGCMLAAQQAFVPGTAAPSTDATSAPSAQLRGVAVEAAGEGQSLPWAGLVGGAVVAAAAVRPRTMRKAAEVEAPPPFNPATQIGAMDPLGFFDPAGFTKVGDEPGFKNLRAAEIKHGRVAMMAAVGAVAQHYVKFPGFETVPSGLFAVTSAPGTYAFAALFAIAGALELGVWTESANKEPGNFGDPLGLNQYNPEMRAREINNGRFAMFAALGIIAAELATGKDAIQQFGA